MTELATAKRIAYTLIAGMAICLGVVSTGIWDIENGGSQSFTVSFDIGTEMSDSAGASLDAAIAALAAQPGRTVIVTGHTGTAGNEEANRSLSLARAHAVKEYLIHHSVRPEQIKVLGAAGALAPPRPEGVSEAAYKRSLPRAVISIASDRIFDRPEG